jgi:hypothetical protein
MEKVEYLKKIIHQTTNFGQQITRSNTEFEGHAQGVEVVLPPTPNQFQNELDNPTMPNDPRSGSNEKWEYWIWNHRQH